jgi:hypothetical protein
MIPNFLFYCFAYEYPTNAEFTVVQIRLFTVINDPKFLFYCFAYEYPTNAEFTVVQIRLNTGKNVNRKSYLLETFVKE